MLVAVPGFYAPLCCRVPDLEEIYRVDGEHTTAGLGRGIRAEVLTAPAWKLHCIAACLDAFVFFVSAQVLTWVFDCGVSLVIVASFLSCVLWWSCTVSLYHYACACMSQVVCLSIA